MGKFRAQTHLENASDWSETFFQILLIWSHLPNSSSTVIAGIPIITNESDIQQNNCFRKNIPEELKSNFM